MKSRFLIVILLFLLPCFSTAQRKNDYRPARKNIAALSCGAVDSTALFETLNALTTQDTSKFTKNMWVYYTDLGMAQYKAGILIKDTAFLVAAVKSFESGLKLKPCNIQLLWNLAFQHYLLNNCSEMNRRLAEIQTENPSWFRQNTGEINDMQKCCGHVRLLHPDQN